MTTVGLPDTFTYTAIELVFVPGYTIGLCVRITRSGGCFNVIGPHDDGVYVQSCWASSRVRVAVEWV